MYSKSHFITLPGVKILRAPDIKDILFVYTVNTLNTQHRDNSSQNSLLA